LGQDLPKQNISIPVNISCHSSTELLEALLSALPSQNRVSSLQAFGDSQPFPLGWGEVLPLRAIHFFHENIPVVILSIPNRRYTDSANMVPELLHLGSELFHILENHELKVAVVISADLAHTHQASGPYGYSPLAAPFDNACVAWAQTLNPQPLLKTARKLQSKAISCGFSGMVMLHGLLSDTASQWTPTMYQYAHPTYYGMLVSIYQRKITAIPLLEKRQ